MVELTPEQATEVRGVLEVGAEGASDAGRDAALELSEQIAAMQAGASDGFRVQRAENDDPAYMSCPFCRESLVSEDGRMPEHDAEEGRSRSLARCAGSGKAGRVVTA